MSSENDYLQHFGIPGMKWGVRRYQNEDGTLTPAGKARYREAKKDADEYARAKMYYGEGAGTRRKLIKNKVAEKSKDPAYKEAFDYAMTQQNMEKHVEGAQRERKAEDTKNNMKKTAKKVAKSPITKAAVVIGGLAALHYTGMDKKIIKFGKEVAGPLLDSMESMGIPTGRPRW